MSKSPYALRPSFDPQLMTVLIVDDEKLNLLLLSKLIDQLGYRKLLAEDGQSAIEQFEQHQPDLILMDVMMPGINGLEATATIKQLANERWVPIIILSALSEPHQIVDGLRAGADDYLNKPLQIEVLKAKLHHYANAIAAQRQLETQNRELRRYHFEMEDEKRIASHLMRSLVDVDRMRRPGVEWWLEPADEFSGDVMAAAVTPDGKHHFMLADGTGHGLAAALSAQPLPDIFYAMTARGFSVSSIAQEINRRVSRMLPIDRFFATTLVSVDPNARMIEVWNGGNPSTLLLDADGRIAHTFHSRHLPLGITRHNNFSGETEFAPYPEGAQLLLMSDGLLTIFPEHPDPSLLETLQTSPRERLRSVQSYAQSHLTEMSSQDDISLMLVTLESLDGYEPAQSLKTAPALLAEEDPEWTFKLHLNGQQLQRMHQELLPMLMGILEQMAPIEAKKSTLFLVISELFNNSLDHGLLQLDSTLKQSGFEAYLDLRAAKIKQLDSRDFIELEFTTVADGLLVKVSDSGPGFDHRSVIQRISGSREYHGRGLSMVSSVSSSLQFSEQGNVISAILQLKT